MLPLPLSYESRQTSSQSHCPIFAIFPPEIRRLIWIECLGGLTLPLVFPHQSGCDELCIYGALLRSGSFCFFKREPPVKTLAQRRLLSILLTCQRVCDKNPRPKKCFMSSLTFDYRYSEAFDILYSRNVFGLSDTHHLHLLPKLLIRPHFNSIHFLNLTMRLERTCAFLVEGFSMDHLDELIISWASQWKNIASMEGLRELHVQMIVPLHRRKDWIREQISLMEPLKVITRPRVFLLTLPFRDPAENDSFLQELPCQIRRAPKTNDG